MMQKENIAVLPSFPSSADPVTMDWLMQGIEKIKLRHRAEKYRYKEDRGGIRYIQQHVKKGDTVFDIGAHKAGYLYFFLSQLGETGHVVAFEPQTILYEYLQKLKELLCWNNVSIESSAVSDCKGKAILCIPVNSGKKSSPCATIIESHTSFSYQLKEEVVTVSLDDYCSQHFIYPDFLKIDVEGNELSVLKGAENILRTYKPRILFECEARFVGKDKLMETIAYLLQLGYSGSFICNQERRPILEFSVEQYQSASSAVYCNNFIFD